MADLKLSNLMVGSARPQEVGEFYERILDRPADMKEDGWYGWDIGGTWFTVGEHSEVKDRAAEPQRLIVNFETKDVQAEFDRIRSLGAEVVKEPYDMQGMWIATFADPDGNYFQLMSPWEQAQGEGAAQEAGS